MVECSQPKPIVYHYFPPQLTSKDKKKNQNRKKSKPTLGLVQIQPSAFGN